LTELATRKRTLKLCHGIESYCTKEVDMSDYRIHDNYNYLSIESICSAPCQNLEVSVDLYISR